MISCLLSGISCHYQSKHNTLNVMHFTYDLRYVSAIIRQDHNMNGKVEVPQNTFPFVLL